MKYYLSFLAFASLMACSNGEEEAAQDEVESKTRIIRAEDRDDLIAEDAKLNKEQGEAFLVNKEQEEGVVKTESGLLYEVLQEGEGEMPTGGSIVKVHYTGKLIDGNVFDSSEGKDPIEFGLNQVIPGWTEGLQLMNRGAKYRFYIPQYLGYKDQGYPGAIPPYSTLIFDVELLDFK